MLKELKTAQAAADKYKIRNGGDKPHVLLIQAILGDCIAHAEILEELADAKDKEDAVLAAENALRAAQAG